MAYLGKEYKFEKEENFEGFLKSVGLPAEEIAKVLQFKPTTKLEKDGDSYIFTNVTPVNTKKVTFKSGVEFEDEIKPGFRAKTTYTVDGDTVTQVVRNDEGKTATFKREFSGDTLKVTITTSFWDGTAYRYYRA